MAATSVSSGRQVKTSLVATSATRVRFGSFPSATTRYSMSRSVMMPFRSVSGSPGGERRRQASHQDHGILIVASGSIISTCRVMKSATSGICPIVYSANGASLTEGPDHGDKGNAGRDDQGRQRPAELAIISEPVAARSHDQRVAPATDASGNRRPRVPPPPSGRGRGEGRASAPDWRRPGPSPARSRRC